VLALVCDAVCGESEDLRGFYRAGEVEQVFRGDNVGLQIPGLRVFGGSTDHGKDD